MIRGRVLPPLWLRAPSRFAGLTRGHAWAILAVLAALAAGLALSPAPAPTGKGADDGGDLLLYGTIVDGVRHGGGYYPVAAEALRAGGYPLRPFVTFRLPTLAVVQAHLPEVVMTGLLYVLVLATAFVWFRRLREGLARPPALLAAALLLAGGMFAFTRPELAAFHEVWAGLLIALSLAVRRGGRWVEAVAVALAAMLIRETAALYVLVMATAAVIGGERREAAGWGAALGVFALVIALHANAVAQVVRPLDPVSPGWAGMVGPGLFVGGLSASTALQLVPTPVAGLLVALALFGWASWRSALAARALATFTAYFALIALTARADNFYWVLLVAPALLVGLAFAPDGLRDLALVLASKRRITVKRLAR